MPLTQNTKSRPSKKTVVPQATKAYHFVGIGGCGMSGLAQMLHQRGHRISGSDMHASPVTDKLTRLGIPVRIGHDGDAIGQALDTVVFSAAVQPDNPERLQAKKRGIKTYKYAQLLGELSRQIPTLAIAGTHGKSTTSGWLTWMLTRAGKDPSYVIGAQVPQLQDAGSGAGRGEHLVVEACEFDRSFLNLHPQIATILNIEHDHLDYFEDLDEIIGAFAKFAGACRGEAPLIANHDDANVTRALSEMSGPIEYFGAAPNADWHPIGLRYDQGHAIFDLCYRDRLLGSVRLGLAGGHNLANALAVAAVAHHAGLGDADICQGLATFQGVARRLTCKARINGITILDDYAHHPTEIAVTLHAIAQKYQPRRLWCVFQPHQHSRTRFLLEDFAASFSQADCVLLPDIYFVRDSQKMCAEITAETLAEKIRQNEKTCHYFAEFDQILQYLLQEIRPDDLVVTMGAGDIWKLADGLVCRLGADRQA